MYDELAPYYHLIYEDWQASQQAQAAAIAEILDSQFSLHTPHVHDISCGIGTQLLGLLERGVQCSGSDLSEAAVARAREEAQKRGFELDLFAADMAKPILGGKRPDVVLSWDNSITHLPGEAKIRQALAHWAAWAKEGAIISIRDYGMAAERRTFIPYGVRRHGGGYVFAFQHREFQDDSYDVHIYLVFDDGLKQEAKKFSSRYFMLAPSRLCDLCREAGFAYAEQLDCGYHSPVIVAKQRAPAGSGAGK